jgi:hypothetical protein
MVKALNTALLHAQAGRQLHEKLKQPTDPLLGDARSMQEMHGSCRMLAHQGTVSQSGQHQAP